MQYPFMTNFYKTFKFMHMIFVINKLHMITFAALKYNIIIITKELLYVVNNPTSKIGSN